MTKQAFQKRMLFAIFMGCDKKVGHPRRRKRERKKTPDKPQRREEKRREEERHGRRRRGRRQAQARQETEDGEEERRAEDTHGEKRRVDNRRRNCCEVAYHTHARCFADAAMTHTPSRRRNQKKRLKNRKERERKEDCDAGLSGTATHAYRCNAEIDFFFSFQRLGTQNRRNGEDKKICLFCSVFLSYFVVVVGEERRKLDVLYDRSIPTVDK